MKRAILIFIPVMFMSGCSYLQAYKRYLNEDDVVAEKKPVATKKFRALSSLKEVDKPRPGRRSPYDSINDDRMGSLWAENVQENFFFAKNIKRRVGDIVIVKSGADIDDVLSGKIQSYFKRLNEERERKLAGVPEEERAKQEAVLGPKVDEDSRAELGEITLRLTEELPRGQFIVKGEKNVFVKDQRFNVAVSGVVKMEDIIANDRLPSSRLLESDVSIKR